MKSVVVVVLLLVVGPVDAWMTPSTAVHNKQASAFSALSMTKSSSSEGSHQHQVYRRIHQLTENSDVLNPKALTVEERWEENASSNNSNERPVREFIFHGDRVGELCRVKVQDTLHHTFNHAHIATIIYLACDDPNLLLQGDVLELNCETGLAGLMSSLVVGRMQKKPEQHQQQNNNNVIDILPSKHKFDLPFPRKMTSLTLADDNTQALDLAKRHIQAAGAGSAHDQVKLRQLDWLHHPKRLGSHLGSLKMYRGILGSDLAYTFTNAKELARAVAYLLQPQIGRFVHVGPVQHDRDVKYLQHFLREGYLMRLDDDAQRFTLRTQTFEVLDKSEIKLKETVETPMEAVVATHHPQYDGVNGDYFFPVETGKYDEEETKVWLEKENRRMGGGRW